MSLYWRSAAMVATAVGLCVSPRAAGLPRHQDPAQVPIFRSGASAVMVDVSVRDASRRVVTGLKPDDFTVLDNGVAQQVDDVSYGRLPIDVTVGLDISRSVTGQLLAQLQAAVTQLMRDLRRGDRLKLMLFNMRLARTVDFTSDFAQVDRALRSASAGGGTALFDTLSVAMITASSPDRRQLIMFFTDGSDVTSITAPDTLLKVAERSRATVSFVLLPVSGPAPTSGITRSTAGAVSIQPSRLSLTVIDPALQRIVIDTGGTIVPAAMSTNLGPYFLQILDNFRSAYVLYYSPKGVERGGFHTIGVTVNRPGAVVQARRGYFGG